MLRERIGNDVTPSHLSHNHKALLIITHLTFWSRHFQYTFTFRKNPIFETFPNDSDKFFIACFVVEVWLVEVEETCWEICWLVVVLLLVMLLLLLTCFLTEWADAASALTTLWDASGGGGGLGGIGGGLGMTAPSAGVDFLLSAGAEGGSLKVAWAWASSSVLALML